MTPCPDDAALRRFLKGEQPPMEAAAVADHVDACGHCQARLDRLTDEPSLVADPSATTGFATLSRSAETPGTVLASKYRLTERIGEGGMGSVWAAQQSEPVRRKVAVKLIKAGMESAQVLARFEAERHALALMDHPNIAKVLDAGLHEGRPFFVMELVKGVPITEFCDHRRLTPRQRLELFIPVCEAVQHAHQKGLIHRDIKPSNVLVALYDERPVPKVIDFGVAKATTASLTEATIDTAFGAVVGTPQYMSPEQATLNNLDIDTRTDIYSLGVLLYELLTGSPPFSQKELEAKGLLEILRVVREVDPPRPSAKLSTADALPSLSASRGTEPKTLTGLLRSELDWVVMKALEKDRSGRYDSANGFAADLRRYLAGEPVLAHPPSSTYLLRKFLRKHRGPVFAAMLVAATLVMGIVGTTVGMVRADHAAEAERQAKQDAERRREEAERQTALANDTRNFFQRDVLRLADPSVQSEMQSQGLTYDPNLTVREVISRAAKSIDGRFPNAPVSEAEIRMTLGRALSSTGNYPEAIKQCERAAAIYAKEYGRGNATTLKSEIELARNLSLAGRVAEAKKLREETLAHSRDSLGSEDPVTISAMESMAGGLQRDPKRREEAVVMRQQVLDYYRRTRGPEHADTLRAMSQFGSTYAIAGRLRDALPLWEEALRLRRKHFGEDHPATLSAKTDLASLYDDLGRDREALDLREDALALQRAKVGVDHPNTLVAAHNLAVSYEKIGRFDDALKLREETLALQKAKLGPEHPATLRSMSTLANSYASVKRFEEALKLRQETLAIQVRILGREHIDTLSTMSNLAVSLEQVGRMPESLTLREETLALQQQALGPLHPDTLLSRWNVVVALVYLKRNDEALAKCDELLALAARAEAEGKPPHPHMVPKMWEYRFGILHERGDVEGCRKSVEAHEAVVRDFAWLPFNRARLRARLAALLKDRPDEAKAETDRAIAHLQTAVIALRDAKQFTPRHLADLNGPDFAAIAGSDEFKKSLAATEAALKANK